MKLRLGLILLLFAASAGILAWMYYAATREPRSPKGSPWAETLADLDACCRRKHVKSVQYDHFAGIAADEERHTAERLFRAMAFSERLQENNCATAILHLGGHYTPPGKIIIFGGTTDGNLERSVAYERQAHAGRSGADIRRAMERGNRYAARILTWASAGDMRNIALPAGGTQRPGHGPVRSLPELRQPLSVGIRRLVLPRLPDGGKKVCPLRVSHAT